MRNLVVALLVLAGLSVNAQSAFSGKLVPATQAVINSVVNRNDVIILTGRLIDVVNYSPIVNAKLNLSEMGAGIINAAVDENGNYALALDKNVVNASSRIEFKVNGYETVSKKLRKKSADYIDMDVRLQPDESQQPVVVRYSMGNDPFSPLVMKF